MKQLAFAIFEQAAPQSPTELWSEEALTQKATELFHAAGCLEKSGSLRVAWNQRLTTTAGRAYRASQKSSVFWRAAPVVWCIELNPALQPFGEAEVDQTLRHELAHVVAWVRHGRRIAPHGAEWREACAAVGVPNESRTHRLPLKRRTVIRRLAYRCPGCEVVVKRVKPFRRGCACLACCRTHNGGRYDSRFRFEKIP